MGKTRKKGGFDPNYRQEQLEVKFDPNVKLDEELEELKANLTKDGKPWLAGKVIVNGIVEPVVFMPFTKYVEGKLKMYSKVAFSSDSPITFDQNLVDRISRKVCRKIKNREKSLKRLDQR